MRRMRQHRHSLQRGYKILEHLQALPGHISSIDGDSRDVAAGVSQVRDEADLNRGVHGEKTIGIDVVALLAAIAPDEARARMTSTFNRTNSSANCGSWSRLPSVDRNSQMRFRPSAYPRSRRPC